MWELVRVERYQRNEGNRGLWFATAVMVGVEGWVMPQLFTGIGRDKYEAMWNLGRQMNKCGVPD